MIKVEVTGISNAVKAIKDKLNIVETVGVVNGLNTIADTLLADSLVVCPKDTGALRESGKVYKRAIPKSNSVEIGYGAQYAAIVHEMPSGTKWTTPGTGNKYLERPLKENRERYIKILEASIAGSIRK